MCALEAEEGYARSPDGRRIFYRVGGKGPFALVMPVNWGLDSFLYTKGLSSLEFWLALVTFDPRGVGRSEPVGIPDEFALERTAEDAAAVADALHLDRAVVFGHSSGGAVALTYALQFPHRVSHLVLISAAASWRNGNHAGEVPYPRNEEEMREQFRTSVGSAVLHPSRFAAALEALIPKMSFSPARFRWAGEVEWDRYDLRDRLRDIRNPTLVVHGREDSIIPVGRGEELRRGIPGARLVVLDECGHWPFVERRAEFVSAVTDFLGLESGRMRREPPDARLKGSQAPPPSGDHATATGTASVRPSLGERGHH